MKKFLSLVLSSAFADFRNGGLRPVQRGRFRFGRFRGVRRFVHVRRG